MTMQNVSEDFNKRYVPFKALTISRCEQGSKTDYTGYGSSPEEFYVESYDIGKSGRPVNAHPLSLKEVIELGELFQATKELKMQYLKCKGVLPGNLLYLNAQTNGFAVWYTPPQEVLLYFVEGLGVPSDKAKIPAMLWKAGKDQLDIYALKVKGKPTLNTALYHAPFFNIYQNGNVCMGTVNKQVENMTCLEDFMTVWQDYFFNSYFSHTLGAHQACTIDLELLWRRQVGTGTDFPNETLMKHNLTINQLIR